MAGGGWLMAGANGSWLMRPIFFDQRHPFRCFSLFGAHNLIDLQHWLTVGVVRNVRHDLGTMLRKDGFPISYGLDVNRSNTYERRRPCWGRDPSPHLNALAH